MNAQRHRVEAQVVPHVDAANNLARWLARSPADAEDIVQESILRAYRSFDGFRGEDAKPWLLAIIRNCFFTTLARTRPKMHVPLPEESEANDELALIDNSSHPELAPIRADQSRKLDQIVADFPHEFRTVLTM